LKPNWFFSVTSRDWKHSRKQYSKTLDIAELIAIPLKSLHVRRRNKTRSSATANSTAQPSCSDGVLYDISREKICWWLINYFYVIDHESYRIRPLRRSRSFKFTDSGTNLVPDSGTANRRLPISVINTNYLPPIGLLYCFQVRSNFR